MSQILLDQVSDAIEGHRGALARDAFRPVPAAVIPFGQAVSASLRIVPAVLLALSGGAVILLAPISPVDNLGGQYRRESVSAVLVVLVRLSGAAGRDSAVLNGQ